MVRHQSGAEKLEKIFCEVGDPPALQSTVVIERKNSRGGTSIVHSAYPVYCVGVPLLTVHDYLSFDNPGSRSGQGHVGCQG